VSTAPVSLFSGLIGVYVGRMASERGHRQFIVPGCIATIATTIFFWITVGDDPSLWTVIVPGSVFLGLSTGMVFPSFIATTMFDLPEARHAVGSSVNLMVQRVGTTFGVALAITFLTATDALGGLHRTLAVAIIGCVVCLFIGLRVDTKPSTATG
jgi:MFS family permease